MIKQECIGIPDMILLLMNFFVSKKIKIKAEIVLSPGGAYFNIVVFSRECVNVGLERRIVFLQITHGRLQFFPFPGELQFQP